MKIVGCVSDKIKQILSLPSTGDDNIYLGESNLEHMKNSHPEDFAKYGTELFRILSFPDYVGQNPRDNSLEFVKEFIADGEFVKVAVRLSAGECYYARSLYVLNRRSAENYIAKGTLKKV